MTSPELKNQFKTQFKTPGKILLLRFSSLGDVLMTTAMIRCVRKTFPHAQIDMVVREDFYPLIEHNPHLTRKLSLPRKAGFAGLRKLGDELAREGYDAVYDAHGSLRTRYLLPRIPAAEKRRFDKHYVSRSLALTFKLPLLDDRRFLEKFIDPLKDWGVRYDGLGPELIVDEGARESLKAKFDPQVSETWVGLIPSAQWPGKRWAPERFRELLELQLARTDHRFVVFGGPEDTFCSDIVRGLLAERVVNLQGKASLREAIAAVALCRYVVANDTGLMHVADALGVPSVLIFGPTSAKSGCLPYEPRSVLVEHSLWCRPCSKNGQAPCIRGTRVCLTRTTAADVFAACEALEQRYDSKPASPLSWVVNEKASVAPRLMAEVSAS